MPKKAPASAAPAYPPLPTARWVPLADLRKNADNPRTIRDHAFDKLVASLRTFPEMLRLRPVVIASWAEPVILGGNMRYEAAKVAGLHAVPVLAAEELTPAQRREFVIRDNVSGGEWDWEAHANGRDAGELEAWGLELPGTFGQGAVEDIDEQDVPAPPADPITKPGDRIMLGKHVLVCGDSTDDATWEQLLAGHTIGCVWTDPPYGVKYVGQTDEKLTIKNDDLDEDQLYRLLHGSLGKAVARSRPGGSFYVSAPAGPIHNVFGTVLKELRVWRQTINWVKNSLVFGRSNYHYRHEPIFYGWKPGAACTWNSDRKQDSILEFDRPTVSKHHPTMKPIALVEYCLRNSAKADDLVVDPFGGSGTTLLAAEACGLTSALIELDPRYCDVIVLRWEELTGLQADRSQ